MPIFIVLILTIFSQMAQASPGVLTYQGRIVKNDGNYLEYNNVAFIFQIANPSGSCVIYQEQVTGYDMAGSKGVFDVPIGSGTVSWPTSGGFSILDAFNNSSNFSCGACSGYSCVAGSGSYGPLTDDGRILKVQFHDGNGWKTIAPNTTIRSVPFAGYSLSAQKLGQHDADSFVLKNEVNSNVSCGGGSQFLTWNATTKTFGCSGVSGASGGMVTTVTAASPLSVAMGTESSTPHITIQASSASQSGYLSSGDWTAFNSKLGPATIFVGDISGTASNISVDKIKNVPVSTSGLSSGDVLKYSGGQWVNASITAADISGLNGLLGSKPDYSQFPTTCTAAQTMTFVSPAGGFICTNVAISGAQVSGNISGTSSGFTGSLSGDVTGTQGATVVSKLRGVNLSSTAPTGNQVLKYDGSQWAPATLGSSDLPSGTLSGVGTTGYLPYYSATNVLADSMVSQSAGKLGIATTTPESLLDVRGTLSVGGAHSNVSNPNAVMVVRSYDNPHLIFEKTGYNTGGITVDDNNLVFASETADITFRTGVDYNGDFASTGSEILRIKNDGRVGIGTATPSASAILDLVSFNKGLLPPRMTEAQRDAIVSPATGLMVYNTTANTMNMFNGSTWAAMGGSGALGNDSVTTVHIQNNSVTPAKLETVSGLSAGTYGSGTAIPSITVDTKGRITAITTNTVAALPTAAGASGKFLKSDGTSWSGQDIRFSDIKNISGTSAFNIGACSANQTVAWSSLTDSFSCQAIGGLDADKITTGTIDAARLPTSVTNSLWTESSGNVSRSSGSVGVGTGTPAASAVLDVSSSTKGFLPPRMTDAEKTAIASPAAGLVIYNTTSNTLQVYNGSSWNDIGSGGGGSGGVNVLDSGRLSGSVTLTKTLNYAQDFVVIFSGSIGGSNFPGVSLYGDGVQCAKDRSFVGAGNQSASASCNLNFSAGSHTISSSYFETSGTSNMDSHIVNYIVLGKSSGGASSGQWSANGSDISYSSGKVGIGTTTPASLLTVSGVIESTIGGIKFPDGSIQTTSAAPGGVSNTMVTSWPDIILCTVTAPNMGVVPFYATYMPYTSDGKYYYRANIQNGTNYGIAFTSAGAFSLYESLTTTNCNTTISALYTAGKAFNIAKGPAAQWLQSGNNAYYNAGNVGIGTSTPAYGLDARSATFAAGGIAQASPSSNINLPASVWTKIPMNSIEYDTDSLMDAGNGRFKPARPGYYRVTVVLAHRHVGSTTQNFTIYSNIFKNGISYKSFSELINQTGSYIQSMTISAVIPMNGTTDYVESYAYNNLISTTISTDSWMTVEFVRSL